MKRLLQFLILPAEITEFERQYLQSINRIVLAFFAAHIPVFALIAAFNRTDGALALALTSLTLIGPFVASRALSNPRSLSVVFGVTSMFLGGLLVHFGRGPVQIEMHFYFFVLIAMLTVFGNPLAIVAAATTVALHHAVGWLVLPRAVFNYDAAWWVVAVHATFVALESVAACFVARSFFDNVIGLEKIVEARTSELATKNVEMRLLLDSVSQGFATIDLRGHLVGQRSATFDRWFGAPAVGTLWFDCLDSRVPGFAAASRVAWDEVIAGVMPAEVTIEQMPRVFVSNDVHYEVGYHAIGSQEPASRYLVVVSDVTIEVQRAKSEAQRAEMCLVVDRVLADPTGVANFLEEGRELCSVLRSSDKDMTVVRRALHTLKGNASLFGITSVASLCHALEDHIAATGEAPTDAQLETLVGEWERVEHDAERLTHRRRVIEIEEEQYSSLIAMVQKIPGTASVLQRLWALRQEPTQRRLQHFAEQAKRIADRLQKSELLVGIEDNDVRLDSRRWKGFWSAFTHAIRNAIDHGIELPDERAQAGKVPAGQLWLRTRQEQDSLIVEIQDDGKGVDWERVRAKAKELGLPSNTQEDLQQALFAERLSTANEVSDMSGRGVGMGALLDATRGLGGEVVVCSARGAGTTVRMKFPLSVARTLESITPAA